MVDKRNSGFTLIELSIVLVIIGLIVGGVLVGRDLISGAAIRAQVSQISSYSSAMRTFQGKYGGLPGDLRAADAQSFGMAVRAGGIGDGDGNDLIDRLGGAATSLGGETVFIWTDLAFARLIEGAFVTTTDAPIDIPGFPTYDFTPYLPRAKLGMQTFLTALVAEGRNYFFLVRPVAAPTGQINVNSGLTPVEAQAIDQKMDDGMPATGSIRASGAGNDGFVTGVGALTVLMTGTTPGYCVSNATTPFTYLTVSADTSSRPACNLAIVFQ